MSLEPTASLRVGIVIAAAGRSERFGGPDKLSQDLGGRPLLLRTVEPFTRRAEVVSIVVAAPPDRVDEYRLRYGDQLGFHGVRIVAGGRVARWETVRLALAALPNDCTHIGIHDAARPVVSEELLDRVFLAVARLGAVVPAVPVNGTVKRIDLDENAARPFVDRDPIADRLLLGEGEAPPPPRSADLARPVLETVDRRGLMEMQTPQVFDAALLRSAYEGLDSNASGVTDDAMVVERYLAGRPAGGKGEAGSVYVVEGDPANIKVTRPGDLQLVRALMGLRPPSDRPVHKRF